MVFHLKPRTFFWIRIFSRSPDTQLCSNDSKHTLRINFRFSFKRKEKAWKALIWQTLRKQVFCGVNIPIYFTIRSQTFRKGTEKRKGAIPIKSNRVSLTSQNHRMTEWPGLEGTSKIMNLQPCTQQTGPPTSPFNTRPGCPSNLALDTSREPQLCMQQIHLYSKYCSQVNTEVVHRYNRWRFIIDLHDLISLT